MSGVIRGGVYTLMAMGLSLILGVMNIPSFCHSEFYMLGAFVAYFGFVSFGMAPMFAILMAAIAVFILGAIIERAIFKPLRVKSKDDWLGNSFLVTIGLSTILLYGAQMLWGTNYKGISSYWGGTIKILGSPMAIDRVVGIGIALVTLVFFWIFLQKTKPGKAIRAASQNPRGAMLVGINLEYVYIITFAVSCALAAIAGACLLSINPAYPAMGSTSGLKSWLVVIMVGFGNVGYCLFGGLILGLIEALSYYFLGSGWQDVLSLCCVVAILLFKPTGLFGSKVQGVWGK